MWNVSTSDREDDTLHVSCEILEAGITLGKLIQVDLRILYFSKGLKPPTRFAVNVTHLASHTMEIVCYAEICSNCYSWNSLN